MSSVANAVYVSTRVHTPVDVQVPGPLWGFFDIIHQIHAIARRIWYWYYKIDIYSNPDNLPKLVAGRVLNWVAGDSTFLRIAAQCVLIAARIFQCIKQIKVLYKRCCEWLDAVQGNYSERIVKRVSDIYEANAVSVAFAKVWQRLKHVAIATFNIFKAMFKLSMYFFDAIEAFQISPTAQNDSINELFVNGGVVLEELVKNQQMVLKLIRKHKPIVKNILMGAGALITVKQLEDGISKSLEISKKVDSVVNAGNGFFKWFLQNAASGFLCGLGLRHLIPDCLIPSSNPKWAQDLRNMKTPVCHYWRTSERRDVYGPREPPPANLIKC